MKTTLQLKLLTYIAILAMINVNSQNSISETAELTNLTQKYNVEQGEQLEWQNVMPEQALDNNGQVKLYIDTKSDILYLSFSKFLSTSVLKNICIYGVEQQKLLCASTADSQFAVDIPSLNYEGTVIIEVETKKNTYQLKAILK